MEPPPAVPLHLTSLAILAPNNAPLYVRAFTGPDDELRAYHLAHAAVDVIEERIVMTSGPNRPAESYLGLLFCMEDMAFYGFQTLTKMRLVLSVALVDAAIKDSDIVAVFRAVHHLLLAAVNNPFLSLPESFVAKHAAPEPRGTGEEGGEAKGEGEEATRGETGDRELVEKTAGLRVRNEPVLQEEMFAAGPEDIKPEWLSGSRRFTAGIDRLGQLLSPSSGAGRTGAPMRAESID